MPTLDWVIIEWQSTWDDVLTIVIKEDDIMKGFLEEVGSKDTCQSCKDGDPKVEGDEIVVDVTWINYVDTWYIEADKILEIRGNKIGRTYEHT